MPAGDDALPECQDCGACCFSESPRHAQVTGDDHARIGDEADALVVFTDNKAFMRLTPPSARGPRRCAALVLEGDRFSCAIYERRPEVCRELARGSGACAGERAAKGPRSTRALALLRGG